MALALCIFINSLSFYHHCNCHANAYILMGMTMGVNFEKINEYSESPMSIFALIDIKNNNNEVLDIDLECLLIVASVGIG